jgi:hypothetical protein
MKLFIPLLVTLTLAGCAVARAAAPANDNFADAQPLILNSGTINGTTLDSTEQKGDPTTDGNAGSVWYSFTAPANGVFVATGPEEFSNSSFLSAYLFEGTSLTHLKPLANGVGVSGTGYATEISAPVTAGKKYYLAICVLSGETGGNFQMPYAFETGGAFAFVSPTGNGTHRWIYQEGGNPTVDLTVGRFGSTVGLATVGYAIQYDPRLVGLLTGTLIFAPGQSEQTISLGLTNAESNGTTTLLAQLSNPGSNAFVLPLGAVDFEIEGDGSSPANDDFANAQSIDLSGPAGTVVSGTIPFPSGIATVESGENSEDRNSIWYVVTAPSNGELTLTTTTSNVFVYVYSGTSVSTAVYSPDENNIDSNAIAELPVISGSTYYIAVNGIDDTTGAMTYSFDPNGSISQLLSLVDITYNARKKPAAAVFTVTRTGATTTTATVHYATNGSGDPNAGAGDTSPTLAVPNVDFTPVEGTLTFPPGVSSTTFQISILRNPKNKTEQKHVDLVLDDPSGTTLGAFVDGYSYIDPGSSGKLTGYSVSSVLVSTSTDALTGFVTITFDSNSNVSAKVKYSGDTYSGIATDVQELQNVTIPLSGPKDSAAVTLDFGFNYSGYADLISGGISTGGTTPAAFTMEYEDPEEEQVFIPGDFTVSLTTGTSVPAADQAPGWAAIKTLRSGRYVMSGKLPDGSSFSSGGIIGGVGLGISLVAQFGTHVDQDHGSLGGAFILNPAGLLVTPLPNGDGEGTLEWSVPGTGGLGGFTAMLSATVSQFAPAKLGAIFGSSTGRLVIGSGSPITFTLKDDETAVFAPGTAGVPSLKFSPTTGEFSGSFTPVGGKSTPFSGVILPNLNAGYGFIIIDGQSTQVEILAIGTI